MSDIKRLEEELKALKKKSTGDTTEEIVVPKKLTPGQAVITELGKKLKRTVNRRLYCYACNRLIEEEVK